jgi:hypothetical protein
MTNIVATQTLKLTTCHKEHYAAAVEHIDIVFDVRSLENFDAMLLRALHQLRSPREPGVC